MHARKNTRAHAHTHAHTTRARTHIYIQACTHTRTRAHARTHHKHTHAQTHAQTRARTHSVSFLSHHVCAWCFMLTCSVFCTINRIVWLTVRLFVCQFKRHNSMSLRYWQCLSGTLQCGQPTKFTLPWGSVAPRPYMHTHTVRCRHVD
jgi:hypothetical protein